MDGYWIYGMDKWTDKWEGMNYVLFLISLVYITFNTYNT